jgi:integrase
MTVAETAASLRRELAVQGARRSYLEGCESMQRVHIDPRLGTKRIDQVSTDDIERLAAGMLQSGRAPKTVRNVLTFLHSIFEHAMRRGWARKNPVRHAPRPKRRRTTDANPDLQFLTVSQLEAVIRAIPDETVRRQPAPTREGRPGPAPPPPDVLGPVLRVVVLTAAMSGLRQLELLGLRWRDVDWTAQRLRVRNTFVRGEHSGDGKLICRRLGRFRWPAAWRARSTAGRGAPFTRPTTTWCSPTPRPASLSTAAR